MFVRYRYCSRPNRPCWFEVVLNDNREITWQHCDDSGDECSVTFTQLDAVGRDMTETVRIEHLTATEAVEYFAGPTAAAILKSFLARPPRNKFWKRGSLSTFSGSFRMNDFTTELDQLLEHWDGLLRTDYRSHTTSGYSKLSALSSD